MVLEQRDRSCWCCWDGLYEYTGGDTCGYPPGCVCWYVEDANWECEEDADPSRLLGLGRLVNFGIEAHVKSKKVGPLADVFDSWNQVSRRL